jgi:hypothetical protein
MISSPRHLAFFTRQGRVEPDNYTICRSPDQTRREHPALVTLRNDAADDHGGRVVLERDATPARWDLLELLQQGDKVLVPTVGTLGDTTDNVVWVIRRMLERGASVRSLGEGLDGANLVRAMDALALAALCFPEAAASAATRRLRRRSTPADIAEIINQSRLGRPVARISEAVGLSVGTIARIRRAHLSS